MELIPFWSQHTGLDLDISAQLFDNFDTDNDGVIKTPERMAAFKAFDNDSKCAKTAIF